MFGTWASDKKGIDPEHEPYEIPMHGLGLFSGRVDAWQGFHPLFKGFGGEEGYIHEKYRKAGHKTLLLPFLRWLHRFRYEGEINYPLIIEERITNYYIGRLDNGRDLDDVTQHFKKTQPGLNISDIIENAELLFNEHKKNPENIEEQWFAMVAFAGSLQV